MKKRKIQLAVCLSSLSLFFSKSVVLAEEKAVKAAEVLTTPISYEKALDYLDSFTSKVWFGNDVGGLNSEILYFINSLVQAVYWLTKTVFYICSQIYWKLNDTSMFDSYIRQSIRLSAGLYQNLYTSGLPLIGFALSAYLAYVFAFKHAQFGKTIIQLFIALTCSMMMFTVTNGKYAIQHFRDGVQLITNEIASQSVSSVKFTSPQDTNNNPFNLQTVKSSNTDGFQGKGTIAVLDKYFDIAVWQSYRYLNADVTYDQSGQPSFNLTDEDLIALLDYKEGDDEFKIGDKKINKVAGTRQEPLVKMLKDTWGKKFSYAFASLVDALVLGIILDAFSVGAFALSLFLVLVLILGAFVAFISIFPTMENALINLLKRIAGLIVLSSLMTFASLLFLWIYDMLTLMLTTIFGGNPLLTAIVKCLVLWLMWKNRDMIIGLLTANRITNLNNSLTRRLSSAGSKVQSSGLALAKKNAMSSLAVAKRGYQTGKGAYRIGKRKAIDGVRTGSNRLMAEYDRNDTVRSGVESLKNVGRSVSSAYDATRGNLQLLQAEGMDDKESKVYQNLRQEGEERLARSVKRRNEIMPYPQRLTKQKQEVQRERQTQLNQATKERLLEKRRRKSGSSASIRQGYKDYRIAENKIRSQLRKQTNRPVQSIQRQEVLPDSSTKERLLENRRKNNIQSPTYQLSSPSKSQRLSNQATKERLLEERKHRSIKSQTKGYQTYRQTEVSIKRRLKG